MTNWTAPTSLGHWKSLESEGVMIASFGPETKIPLIAPEGMGAFVLKAFESKTGRSRGKIVGLASEELTLHEIVALMSDISGKEVSAKLRSLVETKALLKVDPYAATQYWAAVDGSGVDYEEVKGYGIELMGFT